MMSITFYNISLVIHVVGITIMAGTTFIDFITFRAFCTAFKTDKDKSLVLENYLYKLQRFLGIGMLLILVSGVMMMAKLHEVWGAQLWFRTKMVVLLVIIINGLGLRRMVGSKLKRVLADYPVSNEMNGVIRNFTIVQVIQMLLFMIIYVLSVFKFT